MSVANLVFLIAGRVLASSGANLVQKQLTQRGVDPLLIVAASFVVLSVLVLPAVAVVPMAGLGLAFWGAVALSAMFDAPGNAMLVASVRHTDLSLIGPLNAYKPVVAMGLAVVVVGEVPSAQGLLGVGIILSGSLFLSPGGEGVGLRALQALARDRGVQLRFGSLVLTASAAVFLKKALLVAPPMPTFIAWAWLNVPVALACYLVLARPSVAVVRRSTRPNIGRLVGVAVLFLLMQYCTLEVFAQMPVAYALALFQLSALVNVFFGYRYFQEVNILPRALGSAIMIIGAAVLLLA